ncbi:MAG: prolyl aminopeptidase [Acidobacteriota bacterium]
MIVALTLALALASPPANTQPAAQPAPATPVPTVVPAGRDWYPVPEPFRTGMLPVSAVHTIHWELCGNPAGTPVMVLHGGPGGGISASLRRYFDPEKWLIVLHDQRGAGASTPFAETRENTTTELVGDVEKLRAHLGLERMAVFGGSWGSTLALAYAEAHPERVSALVLRGIFTCTSSEIDHFYHGGAEVFFPDAYADLRAVIPHPERKDWPRQLLDLTNSDDAAVRDRAAYAWALYEVRMVAVGQTAKDAAAELKDFDPLAFSRIENLYLANGCFITEGQLLRDAAPIADIPTVIVQGRYDAICPPITAWRLHHALRRSRLVLVEDAGHSAGAEPLRRALVEAVRSLEDTAKTPPSQP